MAENVKSWRTAACLFYIDEAFQSPWQGFECCFFRSRRSTLTEPLHLVCCSLWWQAQYVWSLCPAASAPLRGTVFDRTHPRARRVFGRLCYGAEVCALCSCLRCRLAEPIGTASASRAAPEHHMPPIHLRRQPTE